MQIIPAIDIRNGKCVRLTQGDYANEVIYEADPVKMAKRFEKEGARMLHIVDLDGAKDGSVKNIAVIKKILQDITIPIEVGGGIRDQKIVAQLFDIGVSRVILGTVALENDKLLKDILAMYSTRIAVALDSKNGMLMKQGWLEDGNASTINTAKTLEKLGVKRFIFTDIVKDGTLTEPNYKEISKLIKFISVPIIASGGISTVKAVKKLEELGVEGVILGKALYEKKLTIKEVVDAI